MNRMQTMTTMPRTEFQRRFFVYLKTQRKAPGASS